MFDFANSSDQQPTDTRSRILQAASDLFLEKGYAAATTRTIAERAGVNEVTLFRHFGSKENLAKEIMDRFGGMAISADLDKKLSGNLMQDLTMIGHIMIKVMTERQDAMRMAICESGTFPELREVVAENPRQLRKMLARYFQRQMDAGLIKAGHTELMGQAFLGMFFSLSFLEGVFQDTIQPEISKEELVMQFVAMFLGGIQFTEEQS